MSLRNLQNSTDTSNVDNTRRVSFEISTALVEQTEKSCCHVVDRERIDLVERSPRVRAIIVEECISDGLSVGIFRCIRIVEEIRKRPRDSSTEKQVSWSCQRVWPITLTCLSGCVISPPFLR